MAAEDRDEGISEATEAVEQHDATAEHGAGAMPTDAEEAAAERYGDSSDETARNYKDQVERGANQRGEGRIP